MAKQLTKESEQIKAKIDALQSQLRSLQETTSDVDLEGTSEQILSAAVGAVTRAQQEQAIREVIASLQTVLFVKEKEEQVRERNKEADAGLEQIKRQARICEQKLSEARDAMAELQRIASPHLRVCQEAFGQLAIQNHLDSNAGFPQVEVLDRCVIISTRY